ncbi:MAG: SDR family oxidoreductase, partial [Mariprofundaceae bacterium]
LALDINPKVETQFNETDLAGITCDVTDDRALKSAVDEAIRRYGGLDIVISNAGIFPASEVIADMNPATWEASLDMNLSSHQRLLQHCTPYLKLGFDPAIIIIASKNVPAPGPGAAAYSVAKAGLTQLGRVAALEMAEMGIRVNMLHPNAVFDTAIWTDEVLEKRAAHYGLSVEEYKTNNLLKVEVSSRDVAEMAAAMAGPLFGKTTGAQLPVDGGNNRVI